MLLGASKGLDCLPANACFPLTVLNNLSLCTLDFAFILRSIASEHLILTADT
jgi:hypothetical protein